MKFWPPLCTYWTKQLVLPHPGIHHRITLHLGFTSLALAQCAEADGRGDRRERERLGQQPQHPTSTHPWYCPSRWQGVCKKMRCNDLCHCGGRWTSEEDWNWCLLRSVMGSSVAKRIKKGNIFTIENMESSRLLILPQSQVLSYSTRPPKAERCPETKQGAYFSTLIWHVLEETQHTPIWYG